MVHWILVKVEEPQDVGKNEIERYLFDNEPTFLYQRMRMFHGYTIDGTANKVHPATPSPKDGVE